ncbi:DUF4124 domain-containing protein [Haliea sp. E1-2-M8]|uniref:DUF4124 domain-containing protein n=1 Tax=Haliea sp. E1-2-M8 TaxID=3064706 RepID=UPI00272161DE|nr:DUF4124 domain-containing protein [Haliea sp. E1-2-M8]MDO8860929.1 DUF4124 domain-containing protein [Haliea sp. E1-2-M8]
MRYCLLSLLLLLPWAAEAQPIYKSTDAKGNVVYTDRPPAEGVASEEVKLKRLNTAPAPELQPERPAEADSKASVKPTVSMVAPTDQTVIPMGAVGNFDVQASVTPPLAPGERLQLRIDGTASGAPQTQTSWSLRNVFRGGHNLTIERLDEDGKVIAESDSVHVQVMRPFNIQNRN